MPGGRDLNGFEHLISMRVKKAPETKENIPYHFFAAVAIGDLQIPISRPHLMVLSPHHTREAKSEKTYLCATDAPLSVEDLDIDI